MTAEVTTVGVTESLTDKSTIFTFITESRMNAAYDKIFQMD